MLTSVLSAYSNPDNCLLDHRYWLRNQFGESSKGVYEFDFFNEKLAMFSRIWNRVLNTSDYPGSFGLHGHREGEAFLHTYSCLACMRTCGITQRNMVLIWLPSQTATYGLPQLPHNFP